ncbi:MAG: ArsR family transcriptional regulator [Thermomicrobiales bacterium]
MAGKKSKSDIESIRTELTELTEAVYSLREQVRLESAAVAAATGIEAVGATPPAAAPVDHEPIGDGELVLRGSVRLPAAGAGRSDLSAQWTSTGLAVDQLAAAANDDLARVLAAIGHRQRLAILLAVLGGPRSAADLVGSLELGTTGAAYHHLNVLLGAGLVTQAERGVFSIAPDRVAMLLTILGSSHIHASVSAPASEAPPDVPVVEPAPKARRAKKVAA